MHVPDPVVSREGGADPEQEALLADSVGLALLVVLEMLTPAERLAFVLHDMFAMPFDEVAADRGALADGDPAARQPGPPARAGRGHARQRRRPPARGGRRLLRRRARAATSTPWWPCSIPTWCCAPTAARRGRRRRWSCGGRRRWRARRSCSRSLSPYVRPALVNGAAGVVVAPERPAGVGHGVHGARRPDRGDRRHRRPGAAGAARPAP